MCEWTQQFSWYEWLFLGIVWTWVAGSVGAAINKQDDDIE